MSKEKYEIGVYGPEGQVRKHTFKNWFLKKVASAMVFVQLICGVVSLGLSFGKRSCDSLDNCAICELTSSNNFLDRFCGNFLNVKGMVMSWLLDLDNNVEISVKYNNDSNKNADSDISSLFDDRYLDEEVIKVKDVSILKLKKLGLITENENQEYSFKFTIEAFRSLNMSLRNIDDMNAIAQIYAFELAVRDYDPEAIDDYYKGIKCRYEDRYFESKEDFYTSIGCADEYAYDNMVKDYIVSKNGDIGLCDQNSIRLSNSNNPRLARPNSYRFNNEDRGQSLVDILREEKRAQSYNMSSKALGTYEARRLHR